MEVVYVKDFDNKRMYINRKYKGKYEDKKYGVIYFDEGSMNSKVYYVKNYDKVKLDIGEPDYNLLYSSEWLATHPNGLLNVTSMIKVLRTPLGMEAGVNVTPSATSFRKTLPSSVTLKPNFKS